MSGQNVRVDRPFVSGKNCPVGLENVPVWGENPTVNTEATLARQVDDKRRLVMPDECPPGTAVDVQQVDADTWLVRVHKPRADYKVVLIPAIEKLPDDPAWEKVESAFAKHAYQNLPPPEA